MPLEQSKVFESLYYLNFSMDPKKLETAVKRCFKILPAARFSRIKGYMKNCRKDETENSQESGWLELNATVKEFSLKSVPKGQEVLIVIGEKLSKERAALYLGRNPDV